MGVILAVCKDVGGTNSLLPVMDLLKKDHQIRWIAQENGRGKEVLKSLGKEFELFSSIDNICSENFIAVISSMCSTAGQSLAIHFKGYCPIVTIQDQWTAGLNDVWIDSKNRPDYILVNDVLDKKFVLQAWPDFNEDGVVITGYPALDKYINFDIQVAKKRVESKLSLSKDKPIILFAGQWWQTGHAITELVHVLNDLMVDVYLIARPHPAMKDNTPEEVPLWEQALIEFHAGTLIDSSSYKDISDLIASSDLVLSMYSTILNEAAILRLQNIAILYPDHGFKVYAEGSKLDEYPMVSLGCTAKAENRQELKELVKRGLTGDLNLYSAQERTFQLDGKNSLRAAKFISSLI